MAKARSLTHAGYSKFSLVHLANTSHLLWEGCCSASDLGQLPVIPLGCVASLIASQTVTQDLRPALGWETSPAMLTHLKSVWLN